MLNYKLTTTISKKRFEFTLKNKKKLQNIQIQINKSSHSEEQQRMADLIAKMIRDHFLNYTLEIKGVEL